jgi:hypothetical protein
MTLIAPMLNAGIEYEHDIVVAVAESQNFFETIVNKDAQYNKLQSDIRELKMKRGHIQSAYNRVPEVHKLNELMKRIRFYDGQINALKRGELPTKAIVRDHAHREALLKNYLDANTMTKEMLESGIEIAELEVANSNKADFYERELLIVNLAIKQARMKRDNLKRDMKKFVNVGDTGILWESPDKKLIFSSRIYNESSSS